jgi:hypothetical protein
MPRGTEEAREEELLALIREQYRDMQAGDRQWHEPNVVMSLDASAFGDGVTWGEVIERDSASTV